MERSTGMEELHIQLRQTQAELRTATAKVDELTKFLQDVRDQMQRRNEDVAEAQGREDLAHRRFQQLQATVSQFESQLKAASQEAESLRREQSVREKQFDEVRVRCTALEENKYAALAKVQEIAQEAEETALQRDHALLREKQRMEELEKMKNGIKQLIRDASVRARKEVELVRKQSNVQIHCMAEELSALQLECGDRNSQVERSLRERKATEEELEKVYKEGRGEPELRKIDALHQRCLDLERMRQETSLTLQNTQKKLKMMEMEHNEEVSRCEEEVHRLQGSLAAVRNDCVGFSKERLDLQQANFQLRREMDELRNTTLQAQKKAKEQVSRTEFEYKLKEQGFNAQMRELEDSGRSSAAELTCLLKALQKNTACWREEASNLVQAFEAKIASLRAEIMGQRKRTCELESHLAECQRQLADHQGKSSSFQRRLTQAELRANTATQKLNLLASQRM